MTVSERKVEEWRRKILDQLELERKLLLDEGSGPLAIDRIGLVLKPAWDLPPGESRNALNRLLGCLDRARLDVGDVAAEELANDLVSSMHEEGQPNT